MQDKSREHDQTEADSPAGPEVPAEQTAPADGAAQSAPDAAAESAARSAPAGTAQGATDSAPQALPRLRWSRPGRLVMGLGAAVTATVVAFAAFAAAGGLSGPAHVSSVIPSPPRHNKVFVEDDDGTGADNQANILSSAAPGLVHVVTPRGTPAGAGLILTASGLVLTSAQVLQGAHRVTVRVVLSGRSFSARLVGIDSSYDLALLQIVGGPAFRPIAVG
ncbi:MAG: trypsin-like peptidase domain-containing protein, partial [Streptosporangiaceae bacterium]